MLEDNEALRDKFDYNSDIFNLIPGRSYLLSGQHSLLF